MILSPNWFFGYDVVLEFLFAVTTFIVALLGFRIYRSTSQKQPLYLAAGFFLISISYILQSVVNFLIITKLNENICYIIKFQSIALFNTLGLYSHMLFMMLGLSVLAFMTLRTQEVRGLYLISAMSLIAVFLSANTLYMFYAISSLFLLVISWHFIRNYMKNKKTKTLLIAVAFLFLLFGSIHFLFAVNHNIFYVVGHVLALLAYLLVFVNFLMVLRK